MKANPDAEDLKLDNESLVCNKCNSDDTSTASIDARNWRSGDIKYSRIRTVINCKNCSENTVYRMGLSQNIDEMNELDKQYFLEMKDMEI